MISLARRYAVRQPRLDSRGLCYASSTRIKQLRGRMSWNPDVLVEEGAPVKKGQPIFQFGRRPYEYKVDQIQAQLAEAKQNVRVLKLDVDVAAQDATRTKVELAFQKYPEKDVRRAGQGAGGPRDGRRTMAYPS